MVYMTLERLRKKKVSAILPLAVLYVLLPIMTILFYFHYKDEPDLYLRVVMQQLHVWIPVFSSWWVILLFYDFVDCEGNELLYLYHKSIYFLQALFLSFFLYSCAVCLFFFVFRFFVQVETFVLIQLVTEIFVISSLTYFLCFLLQNTGSAFLMIVAYCIYIVLFDSLRILSFMSIFPENGIVSVKNITLIKHSLIASSLFLIAGFICSRFRRILK